MQRLSKLSDNDLYAEMKVVKDQIDACAVEHLAIVEKQKALVAQLQPLTEEFEKRERKFYNSLAGKAKGDIRKAVAAHAAEKQKSLEARRATVAEAGK